MIGTRENGIRGAIIPRPRGAWLRAASSLLVQSRLTGGERVARLRIMDIAAIVRQALDEDLPDATSNAIFGETEPGRAEFITKAPGIVAGLDFAAETFRQLDSDTRFTALIADGHPVSAGTRLAVVEGPARILLAGERTALNFLQRASGIATKTRRYVESVTGTSVAILDTRKTAPGLRLLDKAAVLSGGGKNHRFGLHDMILVKNNHIDRAGGIGPAIDAIRESGTELPIMIEVRDLRELDQALEQRPRFILLDNMDLETMKICVERTAAHPAGGMVELEASGGITLTNVYEIARTGVHRISVGALTHSVEALDISMRISAGPPAGPKLAQR